MKRALCVWLANWPLQRRLVERPELRDRAVALYRSVGSKGLRVTACSREAIEAGLVPGMPIAEASALARRITRGKRAAKGGAVFERDDPAADRAALEELGGWCQRFTPLVSVEKSDQPESLFLDVTGCGPLFRGEEELAKQVARRLEERSLVARVVVADSAAAAWGLARYGHFSAKPGAPGSALTGSSAVSVLAPGFAAFAPAGWAVVAPGGTAEAVAPLPIEALRLPAAPLETLRELGIERVGQLESLPRGGVAARLGAVVIDQWDRATGKRPDAMVPHRPLPFVETTATFEYAVDRLGLVEPFLPEIVERLLAGLRPGQGIQHLRCRLGHEGMGPSEVEIDLFRPTTIASHVMELLRLRFERWRLPAPIASVTLVGSAIATIPVRQGEMFDLGLGLERSRELAGLIDRLASRLGRAAVLRVRHQPDAQPEQACQLIPLVGTTLGGTARGGDAPRALAGPSSLEDELALRGQSAPLLALRGRPVRLLAPPRLVVATARVMDGPPIRFRVEGETGEFRLARAWGPERIETGWWRGPPVRRDYYRVRTDEGRECWLFCRLDDRRWFLHGWFD